MGQNNNNMGSIIITEEIMDKIVTGEPRLTSPMAEKKESEIIPVFKE